MKVALVLFDWFSHGGLQRDCRRIGEQLVNSGASVAVVCMSCEGELPAGMRLECPALDKGSKVARRRAFAAYLQEHLAREDYDLVLGFNRLPGLDVYFAADTCFAWKATRERNWFYRFAPRSRQYLAFERAVFAPGATTRLLMLSPLQKDEYLACYPQAASRMVDIPPGIDKSRMAGDDAPALRQSCREELGVADDETLLLQVGSGFPNKGLDRSLKAVASFPEAIREKVKLFIIGRDDPGRFKDLAGTLGIESRVTFIKGRDDLPRFFQGADLLLHPSYKESAGMVILEAIVAGLPVLTTASCGYAFHVTRANAGCVIDSPFRQQDMNAVLLGMLQDKDRQRWRDNGIRYGREQDLYAMPERVAALVLESAGGSRDAG